MNRDQTLTSSLAVARPFFEPRHEALAAQLAETVAPARAALSAAPKLVAEAMGASGLDLFRHLLPAEAGGAVDVRSLVLVREALAQRSATVWCFQVLSCQRSKSGSSSGALACRSATSVSTLSTSTGGSFSGRNRLTPINACCPESMRAWVRWASANEDSMNVISA